MTEARAFCPQCKQDAVFLKTGRLNTCSACGFQYESSPAGPPPLPVRSSTTDGWGFLGALVKAVLVMAALAVIGVAVLFAGCAFVMKGGF